MIKHYRWPLSLALLPMAIGVGILITWLLTRRDDLALAGIWSIYLGFVFLAAGFITLVFAHRSARRAGSFPRRRIWSWTLATSLVLLANLPAAWGCVWVAIEVATCYTVQIRNESGRPVDSATVSGAGLEIPFGRIASGSHARRYFWVQQDGALIVTIHQGSETRSIPVSGYVSSMIGGSSVVRIKPGFKLEEFHRR